MQRPVEATTASLPLTAAERLAFQELGYVLLPPLLDPPTLARLHQAVVERWQLAIADAERRQAADPDIVRTRAFLVHNHLHGNAFTEVLRHPRLAAIAQALCGPDVDIFWSQAIVKPGQTGRSLAWHQDAQYAITSPLDPGFTALLAVTDMTVANGTVWVLPSRHHGGLLPHTYHVDRAEWQGCYDTSARIPVEMQAGQALIFSRLLPHYSGPNTTDTTRISFQIGYCPPGVRRVADGQPFGDQFPLLRDSQVCNDG